MSSALPLAAAAVKHQEMSETDAWDSAVVEMPRYFIWTSWLNRVAAAVLLIPALPIIGLLVLLTRLSSRGPGVYPQTRVGLHGRTFTVYKIRTMCQDAEAKSGPVWAGVNDPRITRLGNILRSLHLDEFPQLFNVLKGDMTLVGPRPERPEFTQFLAREIPGYLGRLCVKPGITGLAQINLPPDSDVDSVRKKLEADMEYIHAAGPTLDFRILICTSLRMVGLKGLTAARLLGLSKKQKPRKNRRPARQVQIAATAASVPTAATSNLDAASPIDGMHAPASTAGRAGQSERHRRVRSA